MKVISKKAKKAIWGDLLLTFLLAALIAVCIWRFTTKHEIMIYIVLGLAGLVAFYWFIKEIIILIKDISRPNDLILLDEETLDLKVFSDNKYVTFKKDDLTHIIPGTYSNKNWLFYEQKIVFRTTDRGYSVNQLDDVEKALDILEVYFPDITYRIVEEVTEDNKKVEEANNKEKDESNNK